MGGGLDVWPTRLGRCLQLGCGSSGNERASQTVRAWPWGAGAGMCPGESWEEGALLQNYGVCFFLLAFLLGAGTVGLATGTLCGVTQPHGPWVYGGSGELAYLWHGCREFDVWHSTYFFRGAGFPQGGRRGRCNGGSAITPTCGGMYLCSWLVDSWGIARLWRVGVCYSRWRRKKWLVGILVQSGLFNLGYAARGVSRGRGSVGSQLFGLVYVWFGPAWAHWGARASVCARPYVLDCLLGYLAWALGLYATRAGVVSLHRCGALARRPALASMGALNVDDSRLPVCNTGRVPLGSGALLPRRYG